MLKQPLNLQCHQKDKDMQTTVINNYDSFTFHSVKC